MEGSRKIQAPRALEALAQLERERGDAWRHHVAESAADRTAPHDEQALAKDVVADPSRHEWRLADAALERLLCPTCGMELGAGERDCGPCDEADGYRFAAREIDRPGVPPGNEHAIRVSSVILRMPNRYPAYVVRGDELFLPLFIAGHMPSRELRPRLVEALRNTSLANPRLQEATTFEELLAIAEATRGPARGE